MYGMPGLILQERGPNKKVHKALKKILTEQPRCNPETTGLVDTCTLPKD